MRDRVFRLALDGGREAEFIVLRTSFSQHDDVAHAEAPFRERPSLVEYHGVEIARPFKCCPITNQEAASSAERGADRHNERNSKSERMRTGDDHHGDHALNGELHGFAEREPDNRRANTDGQRDVSYPVVLKIDAYDSVHERFRVSIT